MTQSHPPKPDSNRYEIESAVSASGLPNRSFTSESALPTQPLARKYSPNRVLAFRTFAYIRVGVVLGQLLFDNDLPPYDGSDNWIELLFKEHKIEVGAVNVVNVTGKEKRHGRFIGRRKGFKKAYVSLKGEGDINFVEGVA